jgi:hypothetical protein
VSELVRKRAVLAREDGLVRERASEQEKKQEKRKRY